MKPEHDASRKFSSPAMMITKITNESSAGENGNGAVTRSGINSIDTKKRFSQPAAVFNNLSSRMPLRSFSKGSSANHGTLVTSSLNEETTIDHHDQAHDNPLDERLSNVSSSASFYSQSSKLRVQIWFKNRLLFIALSLIILTILIVIIFLLVESWRKH